MDDKQKQYLFGLICVFAVVVISFCILRMIPFGLAGEIDKVKYYFVILIVAVLVGLPAGVFYYYFQGRVVHEDKDMERMRIEADILAHMGEKVSKPRNSSKRN